MKPAALVHDGASLGQTLGELRALGARVFATPKAVEILEAAGIHATPTAFEGGVTRIHSFGHKEIHLFGFDLCSDGTEGARMCLEDRVFYTNDVLAKQASDLLAVFIILA
jgi:hypothetical protein